MRRYMRRGMTGREKRRLLLFLVCAALIALAVTAMTQLRPILTSLATARVSNAVTRVVNTSVNETLYDAGVDYDRLISLEKDNEGHITAVKSNMAEFNRLQSAVLADVLQRLSEVSTRELAIQIADELRGLLTFYKDIRVTVVYGGQRLEPQIRSLQQHPQIVVATPGRLMDHYNRKNLRLDRIKTVILDEADRMLDMGFYDDIMQVHKQLPPYCQTIMFSATMPPKIRTLAKTILKDPEEVKIAISRPPESIMQTAYICYDPQKLKILQDLFTQSRPQRVIIFSSSKMKVKELASTLKRLKFNVAAMHSDLEQSQREEVMKEFKSGHIDILVATDVVARGIDINDIKLVVNFDIPHDPEDYVHRIGRTARGTNGEGLAITFVSIDEQAQFKRIEDFLEKEVYKIPVSPEFGEVPLYEPEKYGMNKRGRGRPRKSEDKGSSSSPQKRNMGHRGRPKKAQ